MAQTTDWNVFGKRFRRGGMIAVCSSGVQMLVSIGSTAILARLLGPDEFGLLAMALTVFAFIGPLSDFGLPHALVHHETFDPGLAAEMFRLNCRLVMVLWPTLVATGPLVAWFYGHSILTPMVFAAATGVAVATLFNLHVGVLRRNLEFDRLAIAETVGLMLASLIAVAAAWVGAGVWSLVLLWVLQRVIRAGLCWKMSNWRPTRHRSVRGGSDTLDYLRKYSRGVTFSRVALSVSNNVDRPLIGSLAGDGTLGLYQKAFDWSVVVQRFVEQPLQHVVVAAASRYRDAEAHRYRSEIRLALSKIYFASLFPLGLNIAMPEQIISILFGQQWLAATPILRLLSLAAMLVVFRGPTKWVFLIEGDLKRQWRWSLFAAVVTAMGVCLGASLGHGSGDRFGVATGAAYGYLAGVATSVLPGLVYATRESILRGSDLLLPAALPAIFTGVAIVTSWGVCQGLDGLQNSWWGVPIVTFFVFAACGLIAWVLQASFQRGRGGGWWARD